jgi:hypothetical protein
MIYDTPPCYRCGAPSTIDLVDDWPGGDGRPLLHFCSDDCAAAAFRHAAGAILHMDKVKAKSRAKAKAARKSRRAVR